jgi:hypothetical protein
MSSELSDFERTMRREIDTFMSQGERNAGVASVAKATRVEPARQASKAEGSERTGLVVKLAVRTKQLELDSVFEHVSSSISRLEAQLEAEKAARQAGYPIVGHVIDIQRL